MRLKTPHSGVTLRPTISAEDRRFLIDSGASLHMRSKDALTPDEKKNHQEFAAISRPEDIWLESWSSYVDKCADTNPAALTTSSCTSVERYFYDIPLDDKDFDDIIRNASSLARASYA